MDDCSGRGFDLATVQRVSQPPSFEPYQPTWTQPAPEPSPPAGPAGRGRTAVLLTAVIVLIVALAAAGTVAVVQTTRLEAARDRATELAEEVADRDARIELLESGAATAPDTPTDPLEDLLGADPDELLDTLEGLLEDGGILDGDGPFGGDLEGLLDGPQADTSGCLADLTDVADITGDTVPEQIASSLDAVEAIRGDRFPGTLDPAILTSEEVRERIADEVDSGYSEEAAGIDLAMLSALGAIPPGLDLRQTQTELLGDQVAGFYDPDTEELVVRSDDASDELDIAGLLTLVHELEHALADAVVGLPALDDNPDDEDAAMAELAIVEGDAVALQTIATAVAVSPGDLLGLLSDPDLLAAGAGLDDVPPYLASSLTFPYVAGPTFVCNAYADGGWDAVDALLQSPPATTAEVLFGDPVVPEDPAPLPGPDGFELVEERTFGAAQLSWLFAAPGGDTEQALEDPVELVRGWQGGRISLWRQADGGADADVVALAFVDGGGLCDAVTEWWQLTEPRLDGKVGTIVCRGDQVMVGVAATEDVAMAAIGG